jgi:hypothetical protein
VPSIEVRPWVVDVGVAGLDVPDVEFAVAARVHAADRSSVNESPSQRKPVRRCVCLIIFEPPLVRCENNGPTAV